MAFRFEDIQVWQESRKFTQDIYLLTKKFPRQELFSLTDQLKRAANSIPANIAEGSGSSSKKEFARYVDIAIKSLYEVVSHLQIACDQAYIQEEERLTLYHFADTLARRLRTFRKYLLSS